MRNKPIKIKVSDIQIVPIEPRDGLVGFASCLINHSIKLGDIAIHTKRQGGYRLVFPAKKIEGQYIYYHQPISEPAYQLLESRICDKYKQIIEKGYEAQGNKN